MAATSPIPEGTCAGPWTGDRISTTDAVYQAGQPVYVYDCDIARLPPDPPPPAPHHFARPRKMVLAPQVRGAGRTMRFLQRPNVKGGLK